MPHQKLLWGDVANRLSVAYSFDVAAEHGGYVTPEFDYAVYQELVNILCLPGTADAGLVPVANYDHEHAYPWKKVRATVLGRGTPGWRDSGGTAGTPVFNKLNPLDFAHVWVGWRPDPRGLAAAIAHEVYHTLKYPDDANTGNHESEEFVAPGVYNIMLPHGPAGRFSTKAVAHIKAATARFLAGERHGAHLPPTGTWTYGWHTLP
jgi:hypothetical protein